MFKTPNKYRDEITPGLKSTNDFGNNGFFIIPHKREKKLEIRTQASDGMGWEHVSISVAQINKKPQRCPTWEEMCWIKDLFWSKNDCVIQYHPEESEYVNMHPFVLHLWKPINQKIPIPQKIMIGL